MYKWNNTAWLKVGTDIDGAEDGKSFESSIDDINGIMNVTELGDYSGVSVSLSANGETLAVGALGHDSMKGHVRVYKNANPITKEYIEQFYNENAGCGTSGIPFDCTRLHVGENNKLECF